MLYVLHWTKKYKRGFEWWWLDSCHARGVVSIQEAQCLGIVPRPTHTNVIGTKWIFKNKLDDCGTIVRNKARFTAQRYTQVEEVDFDETFSPIARIWIIRLLFAIACYMKFTLFQMDVKSVLLNEFLQEEAYVEQPKGFVDPQFSNHVYHLRKAIYGLKQATRA